MSSPKSLEYQTHLSWDGKSGGEAKFTGHPPLSLDTPTEFGGGGRYPCPDELFFSAIGGCLLTTFLYFKRRAKLEIDDLHISVKGKVDLVGLEFFLALTKF